MATLFAGFNRVYNGRRQHVPKGRSPEMVLLVYLITKPDRANSHAKPPDPDALSKALHVAASAREI